MGDRPPFYTMGITRDSRHKRSASGAMRAHYRHKRKFEIGRQAAMTRLGPKRIHQVRVRGGNIKHRAMRLETGNYAWGSEHVTRKTRIIGVVYNASNNELVRTNTLVKGCIVEIDAAPFVDWYKGYYGVSLNNKAKTPEPSAERKKELAAKAKARKIYEEKTGKQAVVA